MDTVAVATSTPSLSLRGQTMDMLKLNKYQVLNPLSAELKTKIIRALQHITWMANASGTDITRWDIGQVFGSDDGLIHTENKEINKRFFAQRDGTGKKTVVLSEFEAGLLSQLEKGVPSSGMETLRRRVRENLRYFEDYQSRAQSYARAARKAQIEIDNYQHVSLKFDEQIASIIAAGFWSLVKIDSSGLWFRTVNPIVLTYKNVAQGVDISVDLGKFCVKHLPIEGWQYVDFALSRNLVFPLEQTGSQCSHPHVYGDGNICFGTAATQAANAASAGNLVQLFTIIQQILTEYNPGSPYISLHHLKEARDKNSLRGGESLDPVRHNRNEATASETSGQYSQATGGALYISVDEGEGYEEDESSGDSEEEYQDDNE